MVGWTDFGQSEKYLRGMYSDANMSIFKRDLLWGAKVSVHKKIFPVSIEVFISETKPEFPTARGLHIVVWHKIKTEFGENNIRRENGFMQAKWIFTHKREPIAYIDLSQKNLNNYYSAWGSTIKNHRNKWLRELDCKTILITEVTIDEFLKHYKECDIKKSLKNFYANQARALTISYKKDIFFYLLKREGVIVAGTCIVDDDETQQSVYQYMFCDKSTQNKHIGVGIIDFCIKHTFKKGYSYLNLTAVYEKGQSTSWRGLTKFKTQFKPKISTCKNIYFRIKINLS
jgi:hypothetical protein